MAVQSKTSVKCSSSITNRRVTNRTEPEFDSLSIYRDESRTETWGAAKYSGGRAGSTSNWPGVDGPPLNIPASSFVVHFSSDGSNNDWGFALIAEALVPDYGEAAAARSPADAEEELNLYPWYIGQPPAHVTNRRYVLTYGKKLMCVGQLCQVNLLIPH